MNTRPLVPTIACFETPSNNKSRFRPNYWLACVFTFMISAMLIGQSIPNMNRLTAPEGTSILNEQTINSIKEDPRGFIWIAASRGLYRYDGTELVKVFAGHFKAIELNIKTHTLAFAHGRGVYLYDYENETSTHITERDIGQLDIDIQCTFFDTDSSLLIGHREGFTRYVPASRNFIFHPIQSDLVQTIVLFEIVRDLENPDLLWIGTNSGLIRYQLASHKQKQYLFESQQPPLVSSINTITTVVPVEHRIYLGTWHSGVVIFDKKTETYQQRFVEDRTPNTSSLPVDHIFAIVPDVQGRLWFSSTLGTMLYDGVEDRVLWHQKGVNSVQKLDKGPQYIDSHGRRWGGYSHGLNMVDANSSAVKNLYCPLMKNPLWYILDEVICYGNKLYFGVYDSDGLYIFDMDDQSWQVIRSKSWSENQSFRPRDLYLSGDTLWILDQTGIYSYKIGSGSLVRAQLKSEKKYYDFIAFIQVKPRQFWVQTRQPGILIADLQEHTLRPHDSLHLQHPSLLQDQGRYMMMDSKGYLWIATNKNLWYGHPDDNELTNLTSGFQLTQGRRTGIHSLYATGEYMWIAGNHGLWRVPLVNPLASRMEKVYDGGVYDIGHIDSGNVWMLTGKQVTHLNLSTNKVIHYDGEDGLIDPGRHGYETFEPITNNQFILGGRKEYSLFQLSDLVRDSIVPTVHLTALAINGIPAKLDFGLFKTQSIRLSAKENTLNFKFSNIGYDNAKSIQYHYMLEGVDSDWQETDWTSRNTTYTQLPGGEYRFLLQATNGSGVQSPIKSLDIIIATPFFQRRWVQVSLVLLLGLALYVLYRKRIANINEKNQIQKKLLQLEQQALHAQMNPHFVFNAMNSIQYLISDGDEKKAMLYLNKFGKLLRTILNTTSKDYIPLSDELLLLENYIALERLRLSHKFSYTIEVDPSLQEERLLIPPFMIQPFVENAIHHGLAEKAGSGGHLSIRMKDIESELLCTIEDNGIGRAAAQVIKRASAIKQESKGVGLVEARLSIYQDNKSGDSIRITDLKDPAGYPSGTRVDVKIPMKPN